MTDKKNQFHCGYVAIVGRPNVGKSTLMNYILGQKISITSRKPQTTRHRILGIKTTATAQMIYADTPGLHQGSKRVMNRIMNRAAVDAIHDVEVIVFVVETGAWKEEDQFILNKLQDATAPVVLVINKVDRLKSKDDLLLQINDASEKMDFAEIIPLSAEKGSNVDRLESAVEKMLPIAPAMFPEDQITDRSERFIVAELIREKLMRRLTKELPYALTVEVERFETEGTLSKIDAVIWVERDSQKAIVIGRGGEGLKSVGKQARIEMEKIIGNKVFLQLWVKVKDKWSDDARALQNLGYSE